MTVVELAGAVSLLLLRLSDIDGDKQDMNIWLGQTCDPKYPPAVVPPSLSWYQNLYETIAK